MDLGDARHGGDGEAPAWVRSDVVGRWGGVAAFVKVAVDAVWVEVKLRRG